mgnify:FL=1
MVRKADILDDLLENGYRSVPDLALAFGVDASTIRRHLARLEKLNLVQRTHGGALPIRHADTPFAVKQSLHTSEKVAIGTAMAARIEDGQTVLLDSGSTTLEVAKRLTARGLTIVTNDLRIGLEVANRQLGHLVMLGGELLPSVYTLHGPATLRHLADIRVSVAVFSADSVMADGVFNSNAHEVELKRKMRDISSRSFLVADSSKFCRESLYKVFDLDNFDAVLTDTGISPKVAGWFTIPVERHDARPAVTVPHL